MSATDQSTVSATPTPGGPTPLSDRERQMHADYEWALADVSVRRDHGGRVVAVNQRRVFGAGANHLEAFEVARRLPDCPPREALAFVAVPESFGEEPAA